MFGMWMCPSTCPPPATVPLPGNCPQNFSTPGNISRDIDAAIGGGVVSKMIKGFIVVLVGLETSSFPGFRRIRLQYFFLPLEKVFLPVQKIMFVVRVGPWRWPIGAHSVNLGLGVTPLDLGLWTPFAGVEFNVIEPVVLIS
jgi:hypothetical protein